MSDFGNAGDFGSAGCFLVGMLISCTLYGTFFILFCATLYIFRYKSSRPNVILLTASVLIFLFTTSFLAIGSWRVVDGLVLNPVTTDLDLYFYELNGWQSLSQDIILGMNSLVADAVMIYRCWVVWNHRWCMVALNILLWLSAVATLTVTSVLSARVDLLDYDSSTALQVWNTSFLSITLVQNVVATTLIAFRLWRVDAAAAPFKEGVGLMPAARIIIESGGLYVATTLVFVVLSVFQAHAQFLVQSILNCIIGVTFSLIIVRVGLGYTRTSGELSVDTRVTQAHPMRPINISVSRRTDIEGSVVDDDEGLESGHSPLSRSAGFFEVQKKIKELPEEVVGDQNNV